jgi:hypothetical protein
MWPRKVGEIVGDLMPTETTEMIGEDPVASVAEEECLTEVHREVQAGEVTARNTEEEDITAVMMIIVDVARIPTIATVIAGVCIRFLEL